jgi:acyl-coenzyme A synthetase/AMP-(fatty) acid ligase
MDDIIDLDGRTLKILGRTIKKLKVNGFSVSPVIIKTAVLDIEGVTDCFIRTKPTKEKGSEILVLEYTGKKYNNKDMESLLKTKLPFYAIPKKFVYKSVEKWGSTK